MKAVDFDGRPSTSMFLCNLCTMAVVEEPTRRGYQPAYSSSVKGGRNVGVILAAYLD